MGQTLFCAGPWLSPSVGMRGDGSEGYVRKDQRSGLQRQLPEAFLNFKPELPGCGYLNLEANAKGTFLCGYGKDRYGRKSLGDLGVPYPTVTPFSTESSWGWVAEIPLPLLQQVYGEAEFVPGDRIKGNFYKCGDETKTPHYGSWNPIENPTPDFHRPEGFGELVILP